jgi:hypothetical protein
MFDSGRPANCCPLMKPQTRCSLVLILTGKMPLSCLIRGLLDK